MIDSLAELLRHGRETAKHATTIRAVTTNVSQTDDNGTTTDTPRDMERTNRIWVYIEGDLAKPVSVWNVGAAAVPYKENIQVYLDYDPGGNLKIVDSDPVMVDSMYGTAAQTLFAGELVGDILKLILPGRNFKPLRVRQSPEYGGLNVLIEDGIYQFNDDSHAWLDKTPIDLSTVSVSSGMKRPVLIGIDPSTETSTTVAGDEVLNTALTPKFTLVDYNELMRDHLDTLWLAGYERIDGITTFQTEFDLVDVRAFLSPGAVGISSGGSFMPIELDFSLTIPANRQTPVRRLTVTADGVLTVNGVLDVF